MGKIHTNLTFCQLKWRIYASVNQASIGPDNGLSPARRQTMIWTNGDVLLIRPLGIYLKRNTNIPIQENALEIVICEMAVILSMHPTKYVSFQVNISACVYKHVMIRPESVQWFQNRSGQCSGSAACFHTFA